MLKSVAVSEIKNFVHFLKPLRQLDYAWSLLSYYHETSHNKHYPSRVTHNTPFTPFSLLQLAASSPQQQQNKYTGDFFLQNVI